MSAPLFRFGTNVSRLTSAVHFLVDVTFHQVFRFGHLRLNFTFDHHMQRQRRCLPPPLLGPSSTNAHGGTGFLVVFFDSLTTPSNNNTHPIVVGKFLEWNKYFLYEQFWASQGTVFSVPIPTFLLNGGAVNTGFACELFIVLRVFFVVVALLTVVVAIRQCCVVAFSIGSVTGCVYLMTGV